METSTLSPKETIINILGRLFNNGHISSDELLIMQHELLVNNPAPEPEPLASSNETLNNLIKEFLNKENRRFGFPSPGGYIPNPYYGTVPASLDALDEAEALRLNRERQRNLAQQAGIGVHSNTAPSSMLGLLSNYVDINDLKP